MRLSSGGIDGEQRNGISDKKGAKNRLKSKQEREKRTEKKLKHSHRLDTRFDRSTENFFSNPKEKSVFQKHGKKSA